MSEQSKISRERNDLDQNNSTTPFNNLLAITSSSSRTYSSEKFVRYHEPGECCSEYMCGRNLVPVYGQKGVFRLFYHVILIAASDMLVCT